MANAIYPKYKQALLTGDSNIDIENGTVKVALIDTNDVAYNAAHDFYDDISAAVVGTPQTLSTNTVTDGVFDSATNPTFTAVTGDPCEALIIYIDTGVAGTSRLVAYLDTGVTGLPVTPNGGDITITWNASGIFAL